MVFCCTVLIVVDTLDFDTDCFIADVSIIFVSFECNGVSQNNVAKKSF
jgi:hypothetical protein